MFSDDVKIGRPEQVGHMIEKVVVTAEKTEGGLESITLENNGRFPY
jgi:hypothetical protein